MRATTSSIEAAVIKTLVLGRSLKPSRSIIPATTARLVGAVDRATTPAA